MSGTDAPLLRKVQEWVRHADEDLRLARYALTMASGCPYRLIAYHAQQCAEKCLKAFLVHAGVDFPYTHSISRLIELCGPLAEWPETIRDAEELTPFALTARYPGPHAEVTRDEAIRATGIAANVRAAIIGVLSDRGVDLQQWIKQEP
ncbi:MAG: HEPN domain-containing protein [Deferrisomatales bacterium]